MPQPILTGGVTPVQTLLSAAPPLLNRRYPFMPGQQILVKSAAAITPYGAGYPARNNGKLFIHTLVSALANAELDINVGAIGHAALDTSNDSVVDTGLAAPSTPANVLRAVVIRDSDGSVLRRRGNDVLDQAATVAVTSAATNVLTLTSHGLTTGATVTPAATYGAGPGLVAGTQYFVNRTDANTFNVAASLADLAAGTYITVGTVSSPANFTFGYMSTSSFKVKTGTASAGVIRVRGPASGSWKAGERLMIILLEATDIKGVINGTDGSSPAVGSAIATNANRTHMGTSFELMYAAVGSGEEVNLQALLAS
jgi:hypothetical protein